MYTAATLQVTAGSRLVLKTVTLCNFYTLQTSEYIFETHHKLHRVSGYIF